jgi:hypothetical protein
MMRVPGGEEAATRLRAFPDARVGSGATDREIADAELELGVRFPAGYRTFLLGAGWAVAGELRLYGLGEDVPEELDVRVASAAAGAPSRGRSIPVARDGDDPLCLDATHEGPYDSPVYRCTAAGAFRREDYVAHDYPSWLWMRLAQMDA